MVTDESKVGDQLDSRREPTSTSDGNKEVNRVPPKTERRENPEREKEWGDDREVSETRQSKSEY